MKKKVIIFSLILVIIFVVFCLIQFFTTFKPGKFGDQAGGSGKYPDRGCRWKKESHRCADIFRRCISLSGGHSLHRYISEGALHLR